MPENILAPGASKGFRGLSARVITFMAALLSLATFVAINSQDSANAAVPGDMSKNLGRSAESARADKTRSLSVTDCSLRRPIHNEIGPNIHINYPAFGIKAIDTDISQWAQGLADAFTGSLDMELLAPEIGSELDRANLEFDLNMDSYAPGEDVISMKPRAEDFELWGAYTVSKPSDSAVSVTFELWNYAGQAEANQDVLTLNYSLITGQRLNFVDIFEKPEVALELMSAYARKTLEPRLGAARRAAMLADGTEPSLENFSSITLTPEGVRINFQPWQVAPSYAGIQKVDMPLNELLPSAPLMALWGK